jgi:uncharacterized protein YktB (UPF0637 family)
MSLEPNLLNDLLSGLPQSLDLAKLLHRLTRVHVGLDEETRPLITNSLKTLAKYAIDLANVNLKITTKVFPIDTKNDAFKKYVTPAAKLSADLLLAAKKLDDSEDLTPDELKDFVQRIKDVFAKSAELLEAVQTNQRDNADSGHQPIPGADELIANLRLVAGLHR